MEPLASDFKDPETKEIDWDAYGEAQGRFGSLIERYSDWLGFPMDQTRYQQWKDRYKDPVTIAFEINRERRSEGFEYMEDLEPGAGRFTKAAYNYITSMYVADVLAGMTPQQAAARAAEEFERIMVDGLPYDIEQRLLGPYIQDVDPTEFAVEVAQRMNLDLLTPRGYQEVYRPLEEAEAMPGMFYTEDRLKSTQQTVIDYYYELMPDEQREVQRAFTIPPGVSFSEHVRGLELEEVRELLRRVEVSERTRQFIERTGIPPRDTAPLGILIGGSLNEVLLPTENMMTDEEKADLTQVRRDWFLYHYRKEVEDRPGIWTDLMERYYGDPGSSKSKFWDALGTYALSNSAFDDPTLGSFLNATARGGLDFSEGQYDWALEWFEDHIEQFTDPILTESMRENPEWVLQAQEDREMYNQTAILTMEAAKHEYYTWSWRRPQRGVRSPREEWERDNLEEWQVLRGYMNERKAELLAYPHLMYFFYNRDYKKWFGTADPDEVGDRAQRLSDAYLKALRDLEAYRAGTGPWTPEMESFIGPNPNAVEEEEEAAPRRVPREEEEEPPPQPTPTPEEPVPTPPPFPTLPPGP